MQAVQSSPAVAGSRPACPEWVSPCMFLATAAAQQQHPQNGNYLWLAS